MITETAAAIVAKVKETRGTLDVRTFPDDPTTYTLKNQHGAILVSYTGRVRSNPTDPAPRRVILIEFDLSFVKKNLSRVGPEEGVQDLLDGVADDLEGFEAQGFVFFPTRDGFVEYREKDATWRYDMRLAGYDKTLLQQLPIR